MRIVGRKGVDQSITYTDAIQAIEAAFVDFEKGNANVPQRSVLKNEQGTSLFMPARLGNDNEASIGIKIVSVRSKNAEKDLPTVPATIIVMDDETGIVKGIVEATELTCIRTASGSAVATKYLSNPESTVLSVFGSGNQGRSHMISICHVREKINKIIVWNRTISKAQNLIKTLSENNDPRWPFLFTLGESNIQSEKRIITLHVEQDADVAASQAHIICTTTDANNPFFKSNSVKPGTHLNCIGSYRLDMQEIESELVQKAKVVADDSEHVWSESGDLNTPKDLHMIDQHHIQCNMGKVIMHGAHLVRSHPHDITLYKSVGSAFMDVAVASILFKNAHENSIGHVVDLDTC